MEEVSLGPVKNTDGMAVVLRDGVKTYGKSNTVLRGLNMTVPKGQIYGLLGPSGCGKSTLLQCILGTTTLDSGSIYLNATSLKDIGYMPQDLCLDETLTVREAFEYYGTLYNISQKNIKNKVEELTEFLELPNLNRFIKEISGGQSRRVSLAISLLHDPKVIILDEPTVGIDPLLRMKIWNEFMTMAEHHQKTIIITTHYIEEASRADRVGFMRHGQLVEEGPPKDILTKYSADTLEAAFLTLCCNQETVQVLENTQNKDQVKDETQIEHTKNVIKSETHVDFYRIKALLKKNYYTCTRDYVLIFTMIFIPILQSFNYGFGIGVNFENMPIAIKNDEISFSACRDYNVSECIFDDNSDKKMSCVVMDYLEQHDYILVEESSREAGEARMNQRNYMAFIYFPKNYTIDLTKYIDSDERFVMTSGAYVHLTNENLLFRNQMLMDLLHSMDKLIKTVLNGCSSNIKAVGIPMEFNALYGKEVKSYGNSVVTLFIALLLFFFPSMFGLSIMMSEKMDGTLSRSMFAGVQILELVIAMFFMSTVLFLAQIFTYFSILYVFFSNPFQITDGLYVYVFIMLLLGSMGFFYGILVGILTPNKIGGTYIIVGSCMGQFILSGVIWPLEGQPKLLKKVSEILPMRLVGNMMNNIALKGWSLEHPSIVIGTSATVVYTVGLVLILIILGKLRKDLWVAPTRY